VESLDSVDSLACPASGPGSACRQDPGRPHTAVSSTNWLVLRQAST